MSGAYQRVLDAERGIIVYVEFKTERRRVVDYAVVLTIERDDERHTVRGYDGSHGRNEMHRHTRSGGKETAEIFHAGTLAEGMRAAISECATSYEEMIAGWQR